MADTRTDLVDAGHVFTSARAYADEDRFHHAAALLRRADPVHCVEHEHYNRFYVVTRHADILDVESRPATFLNGRGAVLTDKQGDRRRAEKGPFFRSLIEMDGDEHRVHRAVTADWFLPKGLRRLEEAINARAAHAVDEMAAMGGECDFARDIAMPYPLRVILSLLGLPEGDYDRMLTLTQELFGPEDSDVRRASTRVASLEETVGEYFAYFDDLTAQRRRSPVADLASVIANATLDGTPMGHAETIAYYVIMATAGHDTTSAVVAGGMRALAERPDQLARIRAEPSLLNSAVDEMIRWVSPVKHMMRTAASDCRVGDTELHAGDRLLLSYWSANHDEEVFDRPFTFDVARTPNKHLAFGFGVHYCLGAMLAKMELRALFGALLPRLEAMEIVGEPVLTKAIFVSGLKRLPLRYRLRS